jgi:hypothetical protein
MAVHLVAAGGSWSKLGVAASFMGNANAVVLSQGEISVLAMGNPAYTTPNYQFRSTDHGATCMMNDTRTTD